MRILALCLAIALQFGQAEVVRRRIETTDDFIFLGKFCFDHTPAGTVSGTLDLEIETQNEGMKLLFFDDEDDSWPSVYKTSLSCDAKTTVAKDPPAPVDVVTSGWKYHLTVMESLRPRFWYVVVARCGQQPESDPVRLSYQLTFLNKGTSHLSCEDEGLLLTYFAFAVAWTAGLLVQLLGIQKIRASGERVHPAVALLTATIACEALVLLAFSLHHLIYAGNGVGLIDIQTLAFLGSVSSTVIFTGLLLLLAKGWTISSETLQQRGDVYVAVGGVAVSYLLLELWGAVMRDVANTVFVFDTPAGWLIVALHCGLAAWFYAKVTATMADESDVDKFSFYSTFRIAFTIWFLAVPIAVIVANFFPTWQRVRFTNQAILTAKTAGVFGLAYLMWPTRSDRYFKITVNSVYDYDAL